MKKLSISICLLTILLCLLPVTAQATGFEEGVYYEYTDYDPDTSEPVYKWRVVAYYFDEEFLWHEQPEPNTYVDNPPSGTEIHIYGARQPVEITGDYEDVIVEGSELIIHGNVETLSLGSMWLQDEQTPSTVCVYGDVGSVWFFPEDDPQCSLSLTGTLLCGYSSYMSREGRQLFHSFAWEGDGETLSPVIVDSQPLPPMFPRAEPHYGDVGGTLETGNTVAVTLPGRAVLAEAAGDPSANLFLKKEDVSLTAAQKSALSDWWAARQLSPRILSAMDMTLRNVVTDETLDHLEQPVSIRFDIPDSLRKDEAYFQIYCLTEENGVITVHEMNEFPDVDAGCDTQLSGSATYVVTRTGDVNSTKLYYIGGGAIAALILGGIIAVSVVKKKES